MKNNISCTSKHPAYYNDQTLLTLAKNISLMVFDLDGVFTDGGLYFDPNGGLHKRFDVQDGLGIMIAREAGLKVAVITGQDSEAAAARMKMLKITDYYYGFVDKRDSIHNLRQKYDLEWSQISYLGDDWIDLAPMNMVGLPAAVHNAQLEVQAAARLLTRAPGGRGAVREFIQFILHAQNKLQPLLDRFSNPN